MKIVVDRDRCAGLGMCEAVAPDYFEVNNDGDLDVLKDEIAGDDLDDIEEAVAGCPTEALRIES
jgi:ferredoxin